MKKVINILLLVVSMAVFMAGCNNAPSEPVNKTPNADVVTEPATDPYPVQEPEPEPAEEPEPEYNPTRVYSTEPVSFEFTHKDGPGEYNKPGFGDEYGVYRFEGTDVAVFNINTHSGGGFYLIGEDKGKNGPSWGDVAMKEGQFLALSDKYMLFLTKDGAIAKDLSERIEEREDGTFIVHDAIPYEELPVEEQEAFVYYCSYEIFSNIEEPESTN